MHWLSLVNVPHAINQMDVAGFCRVTSSTVCRSSLSHWQRDRHEEVGEVGTGRHANTNTPRRTSLHRPNPPSQQAGAPPCASGGAWAERASRDGEAGPAWAAPTGAPRTQRATEVRSKMARTEAETSWSRHTGLRAASRG